ncbi:MAG: glycosyl transferase family protein [uncultured bacterium]|nr:MAG: glycosyl transferase family protein [uncultured bacterium]
MNKKISNIPRLLSVIVPAYKQEKTIQKDLVNIITTLDQGLTNTNFEVVCIVDGELDNTYKEASKVKSDKLKIFSYKENQGKGYAVRFGMSKAKGDLISFLDAGMDISPKGIMMLMAHMEWYDADIIVGSKKHPASRVNYPFLRSILSFGYHFGVKILFNLDVSDTQSGVKIFKRKVVEKILPKLLVKSYAMDIEMLAVARFLGFNRIYEGPIEVHFDKSMSKIKWIDGLKAIWDTLAVFYRLRILHYYGK